MTSLFYSPLIKYRVDVLPSSELKKENINTKALVVIGDGIDREKISEDLELNPLLVRIVDKDSSKEEVEYNKVVLETPG